MAKNFYITTTLPYVNAAPHLGFALEIIQADVIARYRALGGEEVFFNTGTDEHGLKIYQKALEEGLAPQKYCDRYAARYKLLKEALNLTCNNFIRTTDEHHLQAAQEFWKRSKANGDIYRKNYKMNYCVGCELEKTDSELTEGYCPIHPGRELEIIEEENYFFRFSRYQKPLLEFYKKNPNFVAPHKRYHEIIKFVESGLNDFSISRLKKKMPWGVSVPGDDEQVMYVWYDALVSYVSALGWPEEQEKFNSFWPGMQVAGKDNLRQQTATWQAMLMSAGLANSTQVFIHGFITSNGQKMSKSLGNVIDPFELVRKYGTDPLRYYLLREISPFEDGDFTYEKFEERYTADLSKGLGNLVARILTMAEESWPEKEIDAARAGFEFRKLSEEVASVSGEKISEFRFNEALAAIWRLIGYCDGYIEKERVWEKKDKQSISNLLFGLAQIAFLLRPFLPETAEKIFRQIGAGPERKSGRFKIKKEAALFPRLEI